LTSVANTILDAGIEGVTKAHTRILDKLPRYQPLYSA